VKLGGYAGQILRVDLSTGNISTEPLPESLARDYIGGRGFIAKILYDELSPDVEPLSPENKLVIASGPLSGLLLPSSGKLHMGTKSPATGGYGDSNVGGHLAPELKYAGYDVVIIEGAAESPCYLLIDDDKVEIRDAGDLWGRESFDAEKRLKDRLGEDFQIATIGPAGERLVKFACVSHDFGRQAGRAGIGTVWGHKKLKALCIRGTRSIPLADTAGAFAFGKEMFETCFAKPEFKNWPKYGTAGVTDWINEIGAFPTRNFWTGYFEPYKKINGQTLKERICVTDKGCFACPIPCGKYSKARALGTDFYVEGPEYESIALLGGNVELDDIREVAYANYVCDQLGLDSISGGNVVAFALECFEKGLLTEERVGRRVAFGDLESVVYLLRKIAARDGIGDLLAEGVAVAAQKIGGGAQDFAMHVKGLEISGYESRYAPAMMLAYMTADIGAHHNRAWAITYDIAAGREKLEGKAAKVIELQHIRPLFDTLGLCRLPWVEIGFELEHYGKLFPLVTGMNYSWEDLIRVSERIWNLNRAFNFRHVPGFGRSLDYPPKRWYEEAVPSGPAKGRKPTRETVDRLLDDYYGLRGWDRDGKPTRATLEGLGLADVASDIGAV